MHVLVAGAAAQVSGPWRDVPPAHDMPTALIPASDIRALLTEEFLRKFDTPGPRYTSYPTADRFGETFGPGDTLQVLSDLRARSPSAPLSLYIHIPFCEQLCYYCGCNKIITKHHEREIGRAHV